MRGRPRLYPPTDSFAGVRSSNRSGRRWSGRPIGEVVCGALNELLLAAQSGSSDVEIRGHIVDIGITGV